MRIEKAVEEFVRRVECDHLGVEGIAVADGKQVILEHRFAADVPRNIYSHTKSFTSTAIGIAVDNGKLSLMDKFVDAFPEVVPPNPQPELLKITLRDFLTMSSGFDKPLLMSEGRRKGEGAPDYLAYMMGQRVETCPGTKFLYSNGDTDMALRMAEKAVGMPFGEFVYRHMFEPMEMGWPIWEHDPQGHPFAAGGLYLTLREMMKLGQLCLMDGIWNGRRIVSHEWLTQATSKQIDTPEGHGYGFQFWMDPFPGCYRADGAFIQHTHVLLQCGLVMGIQCSESVKLNDVSSLIFNELLPELIAG